MPVDLDVEHCNKPLKTDVHTYRGDITDKTLQRISRSVEETERILTNFDRQTHVKKQSGKHKEMYWEDDVTKLVGLLHDKKVYQQFPGRQHVHIGHISANPLATMDIKDLHKWLKGCVQTFAKKRYYQ